LCAAVALVSIGVASAAPSGSVEQAGAGKQVVVAYYAGWDSSRGYDVQEIPAHEITDLNYAFAKPTAGGTCAPANAWVDYQRPMRISAEAVDGVADVDANGDPVAGQHLFGNFNQLRELKATAPKLKVLISIGGSSSSRYFSDVAATASARAKFVGSCIDTFIKGDLPKGGRLAQAGGPGSAAGLFDGIDLDWEFPGVGAHARAADRHNATLLLQEFRRRLDAVGAKADKHYLLTAALPAGDGSSLASWQLPQATVALDWVNLMTYDFHGPWDPWTNFTSPFALDSSDPTPSAQRPVSNTVATIALYRALGVAADKLVVGVPFYARQYLRVRAANSGLYQPFDNQGLNSDATDWTKTPTPSYHQLVDIAAIAGSHASPVRGFTRHWDASAGEPWLYAPPPRRLRRPGGVFISYENPRSLAERVSLIRSLRLRGAMIWEIGQDDNAHDLVHALRPLLTGG